MERLDTGRDLTAHQRRARLSALPPAGDAAVGLMAARQVRETRTENSRTERPAQAGIEPTNTPRLSRPCHRSQ